MAGGGTSPRNKRKRSANNKALKKNPAKQPKPKKVNR